MMVMVYPVISNVSVRFSVYGSVHVRLSCVELKYSVFRPVGGFSRPEMHTI